MGMNHPYPGAVSTANNRLEGSDMPTDDSLMLAEKYRIDRETFERAETERWEISTRARQRETALQMAITACQSHGVPELILQAAQKFAAFLQEG